MLDVDIHLTVRGWRSYLHFGRPGYTSVNFSTNFVLGNCFLQNRYRVCITAQYKQSLHINFKKVLLCLKYADLQIQQQDFWESSSIFQLKRIMGAILDRNGSPGPFFKVTTHVQIQMMYIAFNREVKQFSVYRCMSTCTCVANRYQNLSFV